MTVIIGIEHEGGVLLAADGQSCSGWNRYVDPMPKLFERDGIGFGLTGTRRAAQLLRFSLVIPDRLHETGRGRLPKDLDEFAFDLAESARTCFREANYDKVSDSKQENDSWFFVAIGGALYQVCTNYAFASDDRGFDAIGCGGDYAMGSLWQTREWEDPKLRAEAALDTACELSAGCSPPYMYLDIAP